MDARFQEDDRNACEYTFANNFVWRKVYHVEVAEKYGCAVIRFEEEGAVMYSYPIGAGDRRKVIDELIEICREEERPLIMSPLSEADREQMLTWYSEQFLIQGDRNDYDYIYSREKLATLAGKKMHGKRNHIARFQDEDDWCYEELNDSNSRGILHFYALYRIPPGLAERERRMAGNMYLQMRHMYSSWKAQAR